MNEFVEYLKELLPLTPQEVQLVEESVIRRCYKRGDYLVEVGHVVHQVDFVISGVFRFFFYDKKGNEITGLFLKENDLVTHLSSFFELTPCSGSIQAETDCETLVISRSTWELFQKEIPEWNKAIKQISDRFLLSKIDFQRSLINQDAKTAYLGFLERYPTVVQRVQLSHIASFLGITQFSLSRIRKQLADNDFLPNGKS